MATARELLRENKRTILRSMARQLAMERAGYGPHAVRACDQLIAEFSRRANIHDGPPPGHEPLPGLS